MGAGCGSPSLMLARPEGLPGHRGPSEARLGAPSAPAACWAACSRSAGLVEQLHPDGAVTDCEHFACAWTQAKCHVEQARSGGSVAFLVALWGFRRAPCCGT